MAFMASPWMAVLACADGGHHYVGDSRMLPKAFAYRGLVFIGLSFMFAGGAFAASAASSPVGSSNVTVADPSVPRPSGKPCVVQLFSNDTRLAGWSRHAR